ncbi:hypothetical protein PCE1_001261 [Barthelona sp. PCE]
MGIFSRDKEFVTFQVHITMHEILGATIPDGVPVFVKIKPPKKKNHKFTEIGLVEKCRIKYNQEFIFLIDCPLNSETRELRDTKTRISVRRAREYRSHERLGVCEFNLSCFAQKPGYTQLRLWECGFSNCLVCMSVSMRPVETPPIFFAPDPQLGVHVPQHIVVSRGNPLIIHTAHKPNSNCGSVDCAEGEPCAIQSRTADPPESREPEDEAG